MPRLLELTPVLSPEQAVEPLCVQPDALALDGVTDNVIRMGNCTHRDYKDMVCIGGMVCIDEGCQRAAGN